MKMNYFVFGTNDMTKSAGFYDEIFKGSGVNKIHSGGRMTLWAGEDFMFGLAEPYDGKDATNGNGTMLGLNVESSDEVSRLHEMGLKLGGKDEGSPDVRSGRFSAYIRDLDNNKICFYA